eukprot:442884_1
MWQLSIFICSLAVFAKAYYDSNEVALIGGFIGYLILFLVLITESNRSKNEIKKLKSQNDELVNKLKLHEIKENEQIKQINQLDEKINDKENEINELKNKNKTENINDGYAVPLLTENEKIEIHNLYNNDQSDDDNKTQPLLDNVNNNDQSDDDNKNNNDTNYNNKLDQNKNGFKWDKTTSHPAMIINNKLVTNSSVNYHSAFSENYISSGSTSWKLKIVKVNDNILIGIAANPKREKANEQFFNLSGGFAYQHENGYLWKQKGNGYDCEFVPYAEKYGVNDVITVHLNIDIGELSFSKNGKNMGVVPYSIKKDMDTKYYLAVCFYQKGAAVKFID